MPFKKGSQEAKDLMARIRLKKGDPRLSNINKKPKPKSKRAEQKEFDIVVPLFGSSQVAVPEIMGVENKGGITLVNPLTNARNLATRGKKKSISLVRKPVLITKVVEDGTYLENINLSKIVPKQRGKAKQYFVDVNEHSGKAIKNIPSLGPFKNAERGRPERLPANARINKERKKAQKTNKKKPKEEETKEETDLQEEKEQEPEEKQPRIKKHQTDEARTEAIKTSKREWARKHRAELKKAKGEGIGGTISARDLKLLHTSAYKKNKDKQVGDWVLDESISKPTAIVYVNQKTNEPIVIHRGTEGTLKDWSNNLAYVAGVNKKTQRFKDSEQVQKQAEEKYGDTLTSGHSQGGIYSKLAKNKKGIIDVNPASMGEVANEGTTIRSKTDPVSLLAGFTNLFTKNKKNITTSAKTNPLEAHSLDILDELGDTQLGGSLRKRGKGLVKSTRKVLGHLVSHITDMKEPMDKRDFQQANMLIEDFKKMKEKKKISGNGIMKPQDMERMVNGVMGYGIHHHHYHMGGQGIEDLFRDMGKYLQPTFDASQDRAIKEIQGRGFEDLIRDTGKYLQPTFDSAQDRAMREIRGYGFDTQDKIFDKRYRPKPPVYEFDDMRDKVQQDRLFKGMGFEDLLRDTGKYLQPTFDSAQDRAMREIRGRGKKKMSSDSDSDSDEEPMKGRGRKGRFVKGSKEAKEYMASIRRKK